MCIGIYNLERAYLRGCRLAEEKAAAAAAAEAERKAAAAAAEEAQKKAREVCVCVHVCSGTEESTRGRCTSPHHCSCLIKKM